MSRTRDITDMKEALTMPEEMKTKSRAWLEAACKQAANRQIEGGELLEVKIQPVHATGSGPNWEVAEFIPPLPPIAERAALDAIAPLIGNYALAS